MRILIGLLEHMGDIVACEPVSRYLKSTYPGAHLTWAVSPAYRELIDTNPSVDQTMVLECLTEWIRLTNHNCSYDKVVDLHVNYRICQHCGVPLIKKTGNPFVNAHEWLDYGTLQEAFTLGAGLPPLSDQPNLYLKPEHAKAVDALALPHNFCVVHLDSNETRKDWKKEAWRELSAGIKDELKLQIVEVGAGKTRVASPLVRGSINLVNKLSILQSAEVIRRARFFIGVDSGPAHLANALQVPGVVLLGRHGFFRQYMPFNGFFASTCSKVRIVRNPTGPTSALSVAEVMEAVRSVNAAAVATTNGHASSLGLDATQTPELEGAPQQPSQSSEEGWAAAFVRSSPQESQVKVKAAAASGEAQISVRVSEIDEPPIVNKNEVPITPGNDGSDSKYARAFAFYLPQFHPIPENNRAYGHGFTEWHNIIKAQPLFRGHYQPRIPGELGFYDLRDSDVLSQQVELAREYGISGFCFYYYYFQGKRLLYDPVKNYVESRLSAPFFFLWANENWTKRWDGGNDEVIVEQKHSKEDDLAFIRGLLPLFGDSRYVKIEGKPLLLIYKSHLFPDILNTTEIWREEIARFGFPGIYLVMADDWSSERFHPRQYGFDASYEIPSNIVPQQLLVSTDELDVKSRFDGRIVDYARFANFHLSRPFPEYKRFRTVMLPWDNTPRYGLRAIVHINGQGDAYKVWLTQALLDTYRRYAPEERIVFLHSWNEWCEGTYLEPDGKYGRMYLEQTSEAVRMVRDAIDLVDGTPESVTVIARLLKMMQAKDEGAFRMIEAVRSATAGQAQRLQSIENSNGWRALQRYYRIRERILPQTSTRRNILKLFKRLLKGQPISIR